MIGLIPWQAKLGAAAVAAGGLFYGGWHVESWRAADQLEAEQLQHQKDVAKLQADWVANIDAMRKIADQAQTELEAERQMNDLAKMEAERTYERKIAALKAQSDGLRADAQRVRDDLAAAVAASRISAHSGEVQPTGTGPDCGGASGSVACGLLGRAIDLASRCAGVAEQQHAALIEAVSAWPKK
jgi:hypothetical protein